MEVKKPNTQHWKQIDQFLTETLRPGSQWNLAEEYPLAFSEKNRANIRFIENEDKVLAHAVMQPSLIRTHYHLFKVGLIGSVVTDPDNQGKGYSKQIIKSCLDACQEQNCDFSILWTDLFNFYSKFGFEIAGSEIALQIDSKFKPENMADVRIMDTPKVSPQALLKVYNQHNLKTVRQLSDIEKYLKIPNSKIYTAWNKKTQALEAYCVMGKGADFQGYIHEWGGKVSALMSLLRKMSQDSTQPITLISPPQCTNLIKQMEQAGAQKFYGVLGMIKIIDRASFCKKIKKGARALGYESFVFEYRDDQYYFGYGDEIYATDSDADITRLVFGPIEPKQIHKFSDQALEALEQIFPIPFWVWGWDSI